MIGQLDVGLGSNGLSKNVDKWSYFWWGEYGSLVDETKGGLTSWEDDVVLNLGEQETRKNLIFLDS